MKLALNSGMLSPDTSPNCFYLFRSYNFANQLKQQQKKAPLSFYLPNCGNSSDMTEPKLCPHLMGVQKMHYISSFIRR